MPLTVEVWHFNHWTTREVPETLFQTLVIFLKGGFPDGSDGKTKKICLLMQETGEDS